MKHTTQKSLIVVLISLLLLFLSGCIGDPVPVTIVIQNETEYEIQEIYFNITQTRGSYSPMHDLLKEEDSNLLPGHEREFTSSLLEQDFGNDGIAIIYVDGERLVCAGLVFLYDNKENIFVISTFDGVDFTIERR